MCASEISFPCEAVFFESVGFGLEGGGVSPDPGLDVRMSPDDYSGGSGGGGGGGSSGGRTGKGGGGAGGAGVGDDRQLQVAVEEAMRMNGGGGESALVISFTDALEMKMRALSL
jgi:hypothetical protein